MLISSVHPSSIASLICLFALMLIGCGDRFAGGSSEVGNPDKVALGGQVEGDAGALLKRTSLRLTIRSHPKKVYETWADSNSGFEFNIPVPQAKDSIILYAKDSVTGLAYYVQGAPISGDSLFPKLILKKTSQIKIKAKQAWIQAGAQIQLAGTDLSLDLEIGTGADAEKQNTVLWDGIPQGSLRFELIGKSSELDSTLSRYYRNVSVESEDTVSLPDVFSPCGVRSAKADWIFCDDFESFIPLEWQGRYFERSLGLGFMGLVNENGWQNSRSLQIELVNTEAESEAGDGGGLKIGFGGQPVVYAQSNVYPNEKFQEVFVRFRIKAQGESPLGLITTLMILSDSNFAQAARVSLSQKANGFFLDPAGCADSSGVRCKEYNDVAEFKWLGAVPSPAKAIAKENGWYCLEIQARLNDTNQSNGLLRLWANDQLMGESTELNFTGSWQALGWNAVFFHNYPDKPGYSPKRNWDNIVLSKTRVGCSEF